MPVSTGIPSYLVNIRMAGEAWYPFLVYGGASLEKASKKENA